MIFDLIRQKTIIDYDKNVKNEVNGNQVELG